MKPFELARKTVELYIKERKKYIFEDALEGVSQNKAGVFVSIKTKDGDLRGCIGTIFPTEDTIQKEIIQNAISASTRDPRFLPITENELNNLKFSVDILTEPVPVMDIGELDPKKYGIIVKSEDGRQALLLPDLEGVDTVEYQIAVTKHKAGIEMSEPISLYKFEVVRYTE